MIVGISSKSGDLEIVSVLKGKIDKYENTNIDENIVLTPVRKGLLPSN